MSVMCRGPRSIVKELGARNSGAVITPRKRLLNQTDKHRAHGPERASDFLWRDTAKFR